MVSLVPLKLWYTLTTAPFLIILVGTLRLWICYGARSVHFTVSPRKKKVHSSSCCIIDFIVHVSSHFLQSTLHWSCFIFISFSPQSISFISRTTVHLARVYLIWLYSYYMVIQPHCQFHFPANPVSGN